MTLKIHLGGILKIYDWTLYFQGKRNNQKLKTYQEIRIIFSGKSVIFFLKKQILI